MVRIARRGDAFLVNGDVLDVTTENDEFVAAAVGIGLLSRDCLAVSVYAAGASGVVVYRIEEGGQKLTGHWTTVDDDGVVYAEA